MCRTLLTFLLPTYTNLHPIDNVRYNKKDSPSNRKNMIFLIPGLHPAKVAGKANQDSQMLY